MAKELLVTLLVVITAQAYVRAEDFAVVGYVPLPLPPPKKTTKKRHVHTLSISPTELPSLYNYMCGDLRRYLPEWRYLQWTEEEKTWRWDALSEHLTHLIIFSIEVGPTGTFQAMDRFPDEAQMVYIYINFIYVTPTPKPTTILPFEPQRRG